MTGRLASGYENHPQGSKTQRQVAMLLAMTMAISTLRRPLWKEVYGNAQQAAKWTAVMEEFTGSKSLNL